MAVLRILAALGFDTVDPQGDISVFAPETLAPIRANRTSYIARINNGIAASGL